MAVVNLECATSDTEAICSKIRNAASRNAFFTVPYSAEIYPGNEERNVAGDDKRNCVNFQFIVVSIIAFLFHPWVRKGSLRSMCEPKTV